MNILIEAGDLNPPFVEGTRNIVIAHAQELIERGHKVVFLTKRKETNTGKIFKTEEIFKRIHYYRWSNPLNLLLTIRKINQKEKIDIIHIFAKGLRPTLYLKSLAYLNKQIIFTLLGYPFEKKYKEKNFSNFLKRVDMLTVTSRTIFEKLKEYNQEKIIYLPYGVNVERYSNNLLKKEKNLKIISLRTSSIEVLKAFQKIKKELPKTKLIIGKMLKKENESKFIEKNKLKGDILEIGLLENINGILINSPIMLELNPLGKTLPCASPPLLVIEAMSSGARIVATDIPEIREVLENDKSGILISNNSEEEIYNGIKKALRNKALAKNTIKKIRLDYNIKNIINKFEKIYTITKK